MSFSPPAGESLFPEARGLEGKSFQKPFVLFSERVHSVALDVDQPDDLPGRSPDRNDDLGARVAERRQVPGIARHVADENARSARGGSAAEAALLRKARVRGRVGSAPPDDRDLVAPDRVDADPPVASSLPDPIGEAHDFRFHGVRPPLATLLPKDGKGREAISNLSRFVKV